MPTRCTSIGANRRRRRSGARRLPPSWRCRSRPARWDRKSPRHAGSPRPPASRRRSARWQTWTGFSPARPARRSRQRSRASSTVRGRPCRPGSPELSTLLELPRVEPQRPPAPVAAKSLGLAACTAIVVGNMVGSGFYLSPSAVAPYGLLAIVAWIVMGIGAVCLGLTFARLARMTPATGGPYAYTRLGFGDFPGFLIAWGYWISIWASLPVIAVAFAGVIIDLFPILHGRAPALVLTLGAIWVVVLINLRGVGVAGLFSEITTYAKLLPFGAIAVLGLLFIN